MSSSGTPRWRGRLSRWCPLVLAAALLPLFYQQAVTSAEDKSATFDELLHLTAGYSYWTTGDFRLHQNSLLPQAIAAAPLLTYEPEPTFPAADHRGWRAADVWSVGRTFLFGLGNDVDSMLRHSRAVMAILAVALGAAVFLISRQLYGAWGALVSTLLFAFSPNFLAHGRLVTSDVATSLVLLLAAWSFWSLLKELTRLNLVAVLLCSCSLLLVKPSAASFATVGAGLLALRLLWSKPWPVRLWGRRTVARARHRAGVCALVVLLCGAAAFAGVWTAFGWRNEAAAPGAGELLPPAQEVRSQLARHFPRGASLVAWMRDRQVLPEAYLHGLSASMVQAVDRPAFLNGEVKRGGWWYYFLYAVLYKTPPGTLLVLLLAAVTTGGSFLRRRREEGLPVRGQLVRALSRTAPLWALAGGTLAAGIMGEHNIGHRHILPLYPPLFILAGSVAPGLGRLRTQRAVVVGVAICLAGLGALVGESAAVRPHYLSYFSSLFGGPRQAYHHLVDSALDWGQDLPGLRRWLDRRAARERAAGQVYLSYFGSAAPRHYLPAFTALPSFFELAHPTARSGLTPGLYCISATMLQLSYRPDLRPWTGDNERLYHWLLRRRSDLLGRRSRAASGTADEQRSWNRSWLEVVKALWPLQFGRLCRHLRTREPEAMIGHSILVFDVSAGELNQALHPLEPGGLP